MNDNFNMDMSYRENVLTKISSLIDSQVERDEPKTYSFLEYEKNKKSIVKEIEGKEHFNEKDWPGCLKEILESIKSIKTPESSYGASEDRDFDDKQFSR